MCQGLGPKKHNEISEIDRTVTVAVTISITIIIITNHISSSMITVPPYTLRARAAATNKIVSSSNASACIHIYIYTYIHTYTHMYIYPCIYIYIYTGQLLLGGTVHVHPCAAGGRFAHFGVLQSAKSKYHS